MKAINEKQEIAIQLSGVKKMYKLGQIGGGTLQADLQSWWARVRGKEDPNTKIDEDQRLIGKTFMALNGIDLTIYKGEALGIIGSNGAGKSTMLKLLSRVTAPTDGTIDIYGRIASMLEVGTGFNPEMTGRENVYMNGAILGMTKAEIDAKMEDIIEFSEVREFIDTPVKRYSSGMFVKLAFSVAAHLDSEIMIMDEVLAVGDMAFQKKCLTKMREAANQEGRTVLYVSHNMSTIRQLCSRCIVLDKGKIIFDGDVESAIGIYFSNGSIDDSPNIDLSEFRRPKYITRTAKLSFVCFVSQSTYFKSNEKITLKIIWKSLKALDEVRIRTLVISSDGIPVGLSTSEPLASTRGEETIENTVVLDLLGLVEGKYFLTMSLFQNDDLGNSIILDTVEKFCSFSIEENIHERNRINWTTKNWGHIKFPESKLLKESKK